MAQNSPTNGTGKIRPVGKEKYFLAFAIVRGDRREKAEDRLAAFGLKVKTCRELAGLTQDDLAERSGLDSRVIRYVEAGQRDTGISNLWPLADGLGIDVGDLVRLDVRGRR